MDQEMRNNKEKVCEGECALGGGMVCRVLRVKRSRNSGVEQAALPLSCGPAPSQLRAGECSHAFVLQYA